MKEERLPAALIQKVFRKKDKKTGTTENVRPVRLSAEVILAVRH